MRKIRYGIIGFGYFAETALIYAFEKTSKSELIAIHKRDYSLAKEKAEKYQIPYYYNSEEDLLKNEEIDAVFISSPNSLHLKHSILAAEAGKHVLCEKPMALNVEECKTMIDVCKKNNVKLMVAQVLRFSNQIKKTRNLIQNGEIGKIKLARCDFNFCADESSRTWIYDCDLAGGGAVFDVGVHCIDTLRYILNDEIIESHIFLSQNTTDTVEKTAQIGLKFNGGAFGLVGCSFECPFKTSFEFLGTNGEISSPNFWVPQGVSKLYLKKNDKIQTDEVYNEYFYTLEIDHFSECISRNMEPLIPGIEGLKNQVILDSIYNKQYVKTDE